MSNPKKNCQRCGRRSRTVKIYETAPSCFAPLCANCWKPPVPAPMPPPPVPAAPAQIGIFARAKAIFNKIFRGS